MLSLSCSFEMWLYSNHFERPVVRRAHHNKFPLMTQLVLRSCMFFKMYFVLKNNVNFFSWVPGAFATILDDTLNLHVLLRHRIMVKWDSWVQLKVIQDGSRAKASAMEWDDLSSISGIYMIERISFPKLSSDLHKWAVVPVYPLPHTHHIYRIINYFKNKMLQQMKRKSS